MRSLTAHLIHIGTMALVVSAIAITPRTSVAQDTPARTALNSPSDLSCRTTYRKLFSKGVANIRVVFGYKDTRPSRFVGDRHERLAFVQRILRPCKTGQFACGFSRSPDNADHFLKTLIGPDQQMVTVKLLVANSSVASDDQSNRENPLQRWQSSYAKNAFYSGIETADVVFYNGHSRFGGGPDFEPPVLTDSGDVEVSHYKGKRPGFEAIRDRLRSRKKAEASGNGLKVLGLFSCDSSQHFTAEIARESGTGLISSRTLIYYADALEDSLTALSGLLEMRCERDYKSLLRHGSSGTNQVTVRDGIFW